MPEHLTAYRIFVASPGRHDDEIRVAFRNTVQGYNKTDAIRRGLIFIPVEWSNILPTRGRAQAIINEQLKMCYYFILSLHDRWGSPPSDDGAFTSGTEEEYELACACLADNDLPMDDLAVFFKTVPQSQISDPGPQLKKVLIFKEKLEVERRFFFRVFERDDDFSDAVRGKLASWVWKHEQSSGNSFSLQVNYVPKLGGSADIERSSSDELGEAAQFVAQGRITAAETILAKLSASNSNPAADVASAELLARAHRRRQSEELFRKGIALAEEVDDRLAEGCGLLGLGRLLDDIGGQRRSEATVFLARAIVRFEQLKMYDKLAESWMLLGAVERISDLSGGALKALNCYKEASEALAQVVRADLDTAMYLGRCEVFRDLNRFADAKNDFERAISIKARYGLEDEIPDAYTGLGAVLEAMGDRAGAEVNYRRSLALFATRRNWIGIADAADHLGHVSEELGQLEDALEAFERSAEAFDILQNLEAAADAYISLARLSSRLQKRQEARGYYERALELATRMQTNQETKDLSYEILDGLERA